jgi:hypothetical protein
MSRRPARLIEQGRGGRCDGIARDGAPSRSRGPPCPPGLAAFQSIQIALSALDRLEVRGRDSAGLHVMVTDHGLDLTDPTISRLLDARATDPLFTSGAVRAPGGHLSFVYKTAAEIGELGDNTARSAQIRRHPAARCGRHRQRDRSGLLAGRASHHLRPRAPAEPRGGRRGAVLAVRDGSTAT